MSARIQPNSSTDNIEDIVWQVFDAFSYATGDLIIGTNPVDSRLENIANIEKALKDIVVTFGLKDIVPWCVLAHINDQAAVEKEYPGATALYFQSIAGCDNANKTFDISIEQMKRYAKSQTGKYGLYFETGQGADFSNGFGSGFDMVVHEARKYGFSRALNMEIAKVAPGGKTWSHTNDVAGFIGPEIFRTREQLVRCCLEDIVMGKLHGLTIGLDICSTLHMSISLSDLDWCIDQIMPANPAYLMALPTKNDPMLSYITTSYQDHVRIRSKFGYKVNDAMWNFFKRIKIVDKNNNYTNHLGDPIWVYYQYRLAKGDKRSKAIIYKEGKETIKRVEKREVPIAKGYGENYWELEQEMAKRINILYNDAKLSLWSEFTEKFTDTIPNAILISTNSKNREDYVDHPVTGENLSKSAITILKKMRRSWKGKEPDAQIVISDGLNSNAIMDAGHLFSYLKSVRKELKKAEYTINKKNIVVKNGRVRVGYAIGNILFEKANPKEHKIVLHIIGERPGTGHHNYSVYIAGPKAELWAKQKVDHDIVKVISGISDTALKPANAAKQTIEIVKILTKGL